MSLAYKKILIKLSGESLCEENSYGISLEAVKKIAETIKKLYLMDLEISIVVGGGNFWRGRSNNFKNKVKSDHIGMLGTVMNALALSECLDNLEVKNIILTSVFFPQIGKLYSPDRAISSLKKGKILIFGYGTGNAFFSTDTASALRASETGAEVILKATANVDGVYDDDPRINPLAKKYDSLTFDEMLSKNLKVIDSSAASICRDNNIPFLIFNMSPFENVINILKNPSIGTLVKP